MAKTMYASLEEAIRKTECVEADDHVPPEAISVMTVNLGKFPDETIEKCAIDSTMLENISDEVCLPVLPGEPSLIAVTSIAYYHRCGLHWKARFIPQFPGNNPELLTTTDILSMSQKGKKHGSKGRNSSRNHVNPA